MFDINTTITDEAGNDHIITDHFYKKCKLSVIKIESSDDGRVAYKHIEELEGWHEDYRN